MVNEIIELLRTDIEALPFVQRYGGLVTTLEHETGSGREAYPVSCNLSHADCFAAGKYKNLAPDTRMTSVFYIEQIGDVSMQEAKEGRFRRAKGIRHSVNIRIVGWLNLNKLGITDCDSIGPIVNQTLHKVSRTVNHMDTPFKAHDISFVSDGMEEKTPAIFSRYTYDDMAQAFMYPYDYFALRFKVSWVTTEECVGTFSGTPVECEAV